MTRQATPRSPMSTGSLDSRVPGTSAMVVVEATIVAGGAVVVGATVVGAAVVAGGTVVGATVVTGAAGVGVAGGIDLKMGATVAGGTVAAGTAVRSVDVEQAAARRAHARRTVENGRSGSTARPLENLAGLEVPMSRPVVRVESWLRPLKG